mmetsp:Transcript_21327/g.24238  ORF Transcript_21327/g.24238 Transcript_21327/m.24238 type:complete len:269 (-) Transcript_21327:1279-2085(-)
MQYSSLLLTLLISRILIIFPTQVKGQVPYFETTNLGSYNPEAENGNPLKGFLSNPDWHSTGEMLSFPSSLEFYYLGLNEVMTGFNTFDWETHLESRLDNTASRSRHAIVRFVLDMPGEDSYVPQFLIDAGLKFDSYSNYGGGQSPDYYNNNLQTALQQFVEAFGAAYDGDTRIGFIQVGLLGFWGEWHTYTDNSGATDNWIPDSLKDDLVEWFDSGFNVTPIQVRYPHPSAMSAGFGLHDDSFAYETLDGEYNGGVSASWFFWRLVEE